jgi:hypothetical protein
VIAANPKMTSVSSLTSAHSRKFFERRQTDLSTEVGDDIDCLQFATDRAVTVFPCAADEAFGLEFGKDLLCLKISSVEVAGVLACRLRFIA